MVGETMENCDAGTFSFHDGFEKGKPLLGWVKRDLGYVSNWYNAKVGLLVQDGRAPGNERGCSILLPSVVLAHPLQSFCLEAQIRQLGDVGDSSVGVVFGYTGEGDYVRYEERKNYRNPEDRFRRLVRVEQGNETELRRDRYESDYIPTHIYFRITEDIKLEAVGERVRVWHDNVLLWDLVVPGLSPGATGLYCKGKGIFACKGFSVKAITEMEERFFQKLPYLQNPTPNSIVVAWETSQQTQGVIEYGTTDQLGLLASDGRRSAIHKVSLQDLEPDARYFYRVRSGSICTPLHAFRTAPARARPFRFCVFGDTHSSQTARRIAENMASDHPDFVVNVGDAASDGRLYPHWRDYFDSLASLFCNVPSYHVVGNHEAGGGNEANLSWFFRYFSHPGFTDHYAFTYSNCRFLVLNNYDNICEGSDQHAWLLSELKRPEFQQADFRIAFFHEPGFCVGWGLQSFDGNPEVRTVLIPMFQQHGLEIMFNGHCHDYERGRIGDIHVVITGGGGGGLDSKVYDVDCYERYSSAFHHVAVDVEGRSMAVRAVSIDGNVLDSFRVAPRK